MVIFSDEFIKERGMSEKQFKIELAVLMYEKKMMTLAQAAELAGVLDLEMQSILGNYDVKIRYEEIYPKEQRHRKAGGMTVYYMAEDFDAPLEDFKDYM